MFGRGGGAAVYDLESVGQVEEFGVWIGEDQVGRGEGLGADARIGAPGKQIKSQFWREPEFALNGHFSVIAE